MWQAMLGRAESWQTWFYPYLPDEFFICALTMFEAPIVRFSRVMGSQNEQLVCLYASEFLIRQIMVHNGFRFLILGYRFINIWQNQTFWFLISQFLPQKIMWNLWSSKFDARKMCYKTFGSFAINHSKNSEQFSQTFGCKITALAKLRI